MSEKSKNKKSSWQQYISIAFFVLIGVICGLLMIQHIKIVADKPFHEFIFYLAALILVMYFAIFVHIIIHEAGHLVFGLISGYKFSSFRILSFMWIKENGKLKLKRLSITGTGGQCLMSPPDMVNDRIPVILYNLGGPLMNLIAGSVFLSIYFVLPETHLSATAILIFAVIGFMLAIMNGVPMRTGTIDNDGYNTISLVRDTEAMRVFWVQMKVNEQTSKGIRLKDMPDEWFYTPSDEAMKNSMVAAIGVFTCNRLMDKNNFEDADKLMEHILKIDSSIAGIYRNLLICDRMYIELISCNRSDIIDYMMSRELKKFLKQMKNFPSVIRTKYALSLLHEKNVDEAQKIKLQFEKCAKIYPYQNDIQSERELLEKAEVCNALKSAECR